MIDLNNTDTTSDVYCGPVDPHRTGHVHVLIDRDASSEVSKVGNLEVVVSLPGHQVLIVAKVGPRSAEGERDHRVFEGGRDDLGFGSSDNVEKVWHVGDLEPENLTIGRAIGLGQVLDGLDLCKRSSIYASQSNHPKSRINAPLPFVSQAWYQVTVAVGRGGMPGRYVEPRT